MNARIRDYCLRRGCSIFEVEGGLEYLVRTWERTVADIARGYPGLLAQQFVNDMRVRQLLHEVWPLTLVEERREFSQRLQAADALFLDHTIEAPTPVSALVGSSLTSSSAPGSWFIPSGISAEQWWYGREPKVRDEDW